MVVVVDGGCNARGFGGGHYGDGVMGRASFATAAAVVIGFDAFRGTMVAIVEVFRIGDNDCCCCCCW